MGERPRGGGRFMVRGWVKNFSATDDELAKMTAKRLFSTPLFANILKYFFSDLDF